MLFKLSVSNIRKSLRDYAVYFFTLIIGVSVFYLFNAIESQTVYLTVSEDTRNMIKLVTQILSGLSVFVAVVLGLLIVYASRFLMKRRHREFALYLTLGMSKGSISLLLLIETILIGAGSLVVGLLIGVGISQFSSALVASLFEADMTAYHFSISSGAIVKTLIYFGIMYIVVIFFNTVMIGRRKLIDLMNTGRRSENQRLKNPALCVILFIAAVAMLVYAYRKVGWLTDGITAKDILICIILGCISTFLIFWSVSGMLLRVIMSAKKLYLSGLNAFTFRQLSSKVNTMVMSMTLICLMLFVTICSLCGAFTIRNSLNKNLDECCPADYQVMVFSFNSAKNGSQDGEGKAKKAKQESITELYEQSGVELDKYFAEHVEITEWQDDGYTSEDYFGEYLAEVQAKDPFLIFQGVEPVVSLSDYNKLMKLFGREQETLADDEYIELCDFEQQKALRNIPLKNGHKITVLGKELRPKYSECVHGLIELSSTPINVGVTVVPDSVAANGELGAQFFTGNFNTKDKEKINEYDEYLSGKALEMINKQNETHDGEQAAKFAFWNISKRRLGEENIGIKALVTFLGLYLGIVFLITSGAILALRSLSDSSDSVGRYDMIRKIGAEESDITHSLFLQTLLFFGLPLALAIVHSVFGMKFAYFFLTILGTTDILPSMLMTGGIILLIYGGYFVITYICSKAIIRQQQ